MHTPSIKIFMLSIIVMTLLATGPACTRNNDRGGPDKKAPGVTATEVLFGSSLPSKNKWN